MTTCSKRFDRLLQAASLGLVGMLAIAGCGGSSSNPSVDAKQSGDGGQTVNAPDGGLAVGSLTVDQATLNFGSVDQGSSSTKTVIVTNLGPTVALSPSVSGLGFVLQGTTCASVAKNATCTITVAFSPAGTGGAPGVLTVAPGFTITLSGVGTVPGTFTATLSAVPLTALLGQAVPVSVNVVASSALTDLSCIFGGPDLTADTADTTCTAAVAASAPCVYAFTFKGAKAGPAADTITCSSSGKVQQLQVNLTVLSPASLAINPTPGAFATVVGTTSSPITFKATNNGTAPSGALTVALAGAGAAQFAITDNGCGASVAGGANCTVTVVFKPIAAGSVTASLTVTDATAGSTPATAVLNGTGAAAAALSISGAATLNSVTVGQAGTASTYTVTNNGGTNSAALKISAADAQFVIGSDLCTGLPLAAGKTCTFTVAFTPASAGAKTTVLTASDGTMIGTLQISATGVAVTAGAALSLTPPTLDFSTLGVGLSSQPQTFTVTNSGGTASGVLSVVKNDSTSSVGGAAQFTYTTTCAAALAPNATCQVVVTFSPTVAGNASATITATDGTVSSTPHTIVGSALTRPGLGVTCDNSGKFTDGVVVGQTSTTTCVAKNDSASSQGTGALTASATGDFAITTNNCAASLAPGLSCTLSLVFKPTVKGARTGTITVAGANGGAGNLNLSGTGLGVVEIQEFTSTMVADLVAAGNFNFGSLSVGLNSKNQIPPQKIYLAVFVRGQVGNLAVTGAFGTPGDFAQEGGSLTTWDGDTITGGVPPCNLAAPSTSVKVSNTVPFCVAVMDFTPQTTGAKTGTLTATAGDGTTDAATIKGNGTGPIYITPSALTFSAVALGTVGTVPMTLQVCNSAASPATGASFTKTGTNQADFVVTDDEVSGATIPAAIGGTPSCKPITLILDVPASETATSLTATITASATVSGVKQSDTATLSGTVTSGPNLKASLGGEFGQTAITGISAPVAVTVSNSGGLGTSALTFTLPSGSEFSLLPPGTQAQGTCLTGTPTATSVTGVALAPNGSCTLNIWFEPTGTLGVGGRIDTLTIASTNAGSPKLTLQGTATSQITISPNPVTISTPAAPSGLAGGSNPQPTKTLTITNLGQAIPASGLSFGFKDVVTKATTTHFTTLSNTCVGGIGAAGSATATCTVDVMMNITSLTTPDQSQTESATMTATVTGTSQTASTVVTGTTAANADVKFVTATNVDRNLGTVKVNGTSATVTYTLKNYGGFSSGPLTFGLYDAPGGTVLHVPAGDFTYTGTTCVSGASGTVLAPGQTCDLVLAFSPTAATAASVSEELIASASPGTAGVISGVISGAKSSTTPYIVELSSGKAPYDYGTSGSTATLQICNPVGGATFTFGGTPVVAFTALTPSLSSVDTEFTKADLPSVSNGCSFITGGTVTALSAGDCCVFGVKWTPATVAATTHPAGTRSVSVTVSNSTPALSSPMTLFARKLGPAVLTAVPSTVVFGQVIESQASATMTVVVTNTGDTITGAVVAATSSDPQLVVVSPDTTCTGTLAVNQSCNLVLSVKPTALGSGSATATVATALASTTETVAVTATWTGVLAAKITPSPTAHDFGNQPVGVKTSAFPINLANVASGLATGPLSFSVDDPDFAVSAVGSTPAATDCGNSAFLTNGLTSSASNCNIFATFTPQALASAAKSGTITVEYYTSDVPPVLVKVPVTLNGTAIAALSLTAETAADSSHDTLALSPAVGCVFTAASGTTLASCAYPAASIAETKFESETFTFTNAGPQTGLLAAGLGGTNAGEFRIVNDTCTGTNVAQSPAAGSTCTVTVRFSPSSSSTTAKTASLTVGGTPGDSVTVNLTGVGNP